MKYRLGSWWNIVIDMWQYCSYRAEFPEILVLLQSIIVLYIDLIIMHCVRMHNGPKFYPDHCFWPRICNKQKYIFWNISWELLLNNFALCFKWIFLLLRFYFIVVNIFYTLLPMEVTMSSIRIEVRYASCACSPR